MKVPFRVTPATLDVLEALIATKKPLHGYAISQAANRPTGSVYPILGRLEGHGWLSKGNEASNPITGRPPRRFYVMTKESRQLAMKLLMDRRP